MKYFTATKAIRMNYDIEKQLNRTLALLAALDKELTELSEEDDFFCTLEDNCGSAYGALWDFLEEYKRYEKGEG